MDIVIPLHEWSGTDNAELRYALRSFEKFMPHDRVVLVGFQPKWAKNVTHIPFRDDNQPAFKDANVFLKLRHYVEKVGVGDDFIYANDDHFLLKNYDPGPPFPHKGTLLESFNKRRADDPYRKMIDNTIKVSSNKCFDYDVHAPMLIFPEHFEKAFSNPNIKWQVKFGYLLKSLYAKDLVSEDYSYRTLDLKIMEPSEKEPIEILDELRAAGLSFFTTSDKAFNNNIEAMLRLYLPDKSKYEK